MFKGNLCPNCGSRPDCIHKKRKYAAVGRERHKDKLKANRYWVYIKHMYGLTRIDYVQILKDQKGKCAVCKLEKKLEVDHDHPSNGPERSTWKPSKGKVRGLVCHRCNYALIVLDNPKRFKELQDYRLRYINKKEKNAI